MSIQHFSVREAAVALGVSEKTVRRRIRSGDLEAVRADGAAGFVWKVVLDTDKLPQLEPEADDEKEHAAPEPTAAQTTPGTAAITQAVESLLDLLRSKDTEITRLQEERVQLHELLGTYSERISNLNAQMRFLEAPKYKARRRSWWRFWARG